MTLQARFSHLVRAIAILLVSTLAISVIGCGDGDEATTADASTAATTAPASGETNSTVNSGASDSDVVASGKSEDGMLRNELGQVGMGPPGMEFGGTPGESGSGGPMGGMSSGGPPGGMAGMGGMGGMMSGGPPGGKGGMGGMMSGGPPGGMPGGAGGFPGMPGAGGALAMTARPDAYSDWTDQNFSDAVREQDPKVLEAIDSRVKSSPGDPKVAELLASLLAVSAASTQTGSAGNGFSSGLGSEGLGYPGAGGTSASGATTPGSDPAAPAPPKRSFSTGPGAGAASPTAPQTRISFPRSRSVAVDSLEVMLAESVTAFVPQGAGVGAIAGGNLVGRAVGGQEEEVGPPVGGLSRRSGPPGGVPGSGQAGAMTSGGAAGMSGGLGFPGGAGGAGNGGLEHRRLVEKIVDGLIVNNTPQAWQTVYAVAAGSITTQVELPVAAEIVVQSLFRNYDVNPTMIDQILVSVIDGSAAVPPDSRSACLRAMTSVSASAANSFLGFTNPVAAASAQGFGTSGAGGFSMPGAGGFGTSGAGGFSMPGAGGLGMSGAGGFAGAGAGGAAATGSRPGFGRSGPPGASGQGLGFPGADSSDGVGFIEGGEASRQIPPTGTGDSELSAELLSKAASVLWSPKAVEAIAKQLRSASDAAAAGDILLLAATVPNQKIREAEFVAFSKLHAVGAESLNALGLFNGGVRDPGMLVVLKSLPRQKPARGDDAEAQPLDSWTAASRDVVMALRDQLRDSPAALTPTGDSFPVRLHRNAVAEVSGRMVLPGTAAGELKDAAPSETKVYYARTSFKLQREKDQEAILDHYESKANGYRRADQARGLMWIDGVKNMATGARRSMDVIIQPANAAGQGFGGGSGFGGLGDDAAGIGAAAGGPGRGPGGRGPGFDAPGGGAPGGGGPGFDSPGGGAPGGGGSDFSIEIIVVETSDPKGAATAATDQTAADPKAESP